MNALCIPRHHCRTLILISLALFTLPPNVSAQRRAQDLFQQALRMERVTGDLEGAIRLYRQVVEAGHRPLGARALIRIAESYEKLGRTGAEDAYARVIRDFGDQMEQVGLARERLAALRRQAAAGSAPPERVARLVLSDEHTDINHFFDMQASPDGRRIVYTDLGYTGAVYIRDLASGDTTKVADGWAVSPIWSTDGQKIAYSTVDSWEPYRVRLSIVDLATGKKTIPPALEHMSLEPIDWSSDGDLLACAIGEDRQNRMLALVSLTTGDTTALARAHQYMSADFSPDGQYVAYSALVDGNLDVYVLALATGERRRITVSPEMEGRARWSPNGDVLIYVTMNSGTWAVPMHDGAPTTAARLLTSERYSQPAGWVVGGDYYYVKYNRARQLLRVPVDPRTMTAAGPPEPLPISQEALGSFAWSPDMRRIANGAWDEIQVYSFERQQLQSFRIGPEHRSPTAWWSADGSTIYFSDVGSPAGATILGLDLSSGAVRELFPRHDKVMRLRPSSDGKKMVFYRYSGDPSAREMQLVVADLGDWNGVVLADEKKMEDGRLARWVRPQLSMDGSLLLYGTQGHEVGGENARYQLWVIPADGSQAPRRIAAAHWIPYAAFHPAGTHVVYNTWDGDEAGPGKLYVVDVRTGERDEIALPAGLEGLEVHQWSPDGRWIGVVNAASRYELWVVENVLGDRVSGR